MNKPSDRWNIWYVAFSGLTVCLALLLLAVADASVLPAGGVFLAFGLLATREALRRRAPDDKVRAASREKFASARQAAPAGDGVTDRERLM
jgi:hypothetical protein